MSYNRSNPNHETYNCDYYGDFEPFPDIPEAPLPLLNGQRRPIGDKDISPIAFPKKTVPRSPFVTQLTARVHYSDRPSSGGVPNSHRKASKRLPLSESDTPNHPSTMAKKTSKKAKSANAPPKQPPLGKENPRVTTRHQAQVQRNHSDSEEKSDATESEPDSSPNSKKSSPDAEKSRAKKDQTASMGAKDVDEQEIAVDKDLTKLQKYLDSKYASDIKVNKEGRMDVIVKLHTKVYRKQQSIYALRLDRNNFWRGCQALEKDKAQLEQEKGVLEVTCKKLSQKLAEKTNDYNELQRSYQRKLTELAGRRKTPLGNDLNKELVASIKNQSAGFLFSKQKFVNNEKQERNLGKLMLHYGTIPDEHKQDKEQFIATYSNIMRKQIFDRRSYIQTEFRKLFRKAWANGTFDFPTVEALIKCVERNIETDDELEVFMYYCEELLGKVVGASEWGKKSFCFTTISGAIRHNTKIPLISASDEAFVVLVVDNCIERWTEEIKEEETRPKDVEKPKKGAVNGKYTKCDKGQTKYGGWSQEGLKYYNDLIQMNKKARESPRCEQVEVRCKEMLRKKHKITAKTWEDQSKRKSRKRGIEDLVETAPEPEEEVLADVEMISDSSDEASTG